MENTSIMAGIYVHIPFCASRCIYCGFYSTTFVTSQHDYVDALIREYEARYDYLPAEDSQVTTIYFGGGTPSQLSQESLARIVSHLPLLDVEEMTIECNPDDVNLDYALFLRRVGFNRVSMGVQTFSDSRLRFLHRRHTSEQAALAVEALREAGFQNISLDLIFGFPGQTLDEWNDDIDRLIALRPEHVSAYSLMYEEGTPLFHLLERGEVEEIDDELSRSMYYSLIDRLAAAGYEQYEISNFSLPGFRSRHNSGYWRSAAYLGLGAAAHSYNIRSRQWNVEDLAAYIQNPLDHETEVLTDVDRFNDIVTTAMRTKDGISLSALPSLFSQTQSEQFAAHLVKTAKKLKGLVDILPDSISLTREGLYLSDRVMREMIMV